MERSPRFESQPIPDEDKMTVELEDAMRKMMDTLNYEGRTRRIAHPKTIGLLKAKLVVRNEKLPEDLKVGIFAKPAGTEYDTIVRFSGVLPIVMPDFVPEPKGCAIKVLNVEGPRYGGAPDDERPDVQDLIFISGPAMPIGTLKVFRDAVVPAINYTPVAAGLKLLFTANVIKQAFIGLKMRILQGSPFDTPYWTTSAFLHGTNHAVKYKLEPTSRYKSSLRNAWAPHYLTENMRKHLQTVGEATFDLKIQLWKNSSMSIEDAGQEWDEKLSPWIKVAELRIPDQRFMDGQRDELSEQLAFNVGHALAAHKPLGALNRCRVRTYKNLADYRRKRDGRPRIDPNEAFALM